MSFRDGNALACLHLRNALSNGVPILLAVQSVHCPTMRFAVDEEIRPLRVRINDFEFAFSGRIQSGGQFFGQFRGDTQIIRQIQARGKNDRSN